MNTISLRHVCPCLVAGMLAISVVVGRADDEHSVLTSVFSKTATDYKRQKGPDGKWEREYYTLVNGGPVDGTVRDSAQSRVPFVAVATVLAQHLARQGYFPATESDKVDLLLVVNWGRTMPFSDHIYREGLEDITNAMNTMTFKNQSAARSRASATSVTQSGVNLTGSAEEMEAQAADDYLQNAMIIQDMNNRARNQANARTAHLLGYMGDINKADGPQRYSGAELYNDLVADIEEARYYITLSAYDFDRTVREKKSKLQWVTRMSMRAPGNSFADKAAAMIAYSASRFGQNTGNLERKLYPQYKVNLEDVRFLGIASAAKTPATETAPAEKQ